MTKGIHPLECHLGMIRMMIKVRPETDLADQYLTKVRAAGT
jgi:hypothetical protein